MVILKLLGLPLQLTPFPEKIGVTEIMPLMGFIPVLVAVKGAMFPLPDAISPMEVFVLLQE